jgi:nitroimidazol reductase NimA-like FMN-containing flavoprotein (pyridoxamine 5'-phosphate oxidase superfamily)
MIIEPATGRLVDLTPAECWERAASRPLGRLAWTTSRGPTVIPVNFTVNGPSVLLRTSAYTEAALEADDSLVAFQVDSIDEASRTGWSVLMRGRAVRAPMSSSASEDPQPWVSGPRTLRLRIDVDEISGRKVGRTP